MPKKNIPQNEKTQAYLSGAVPAEALFERVDALQGDAEQAEDQVVELKMQGRKRINKDLARQAREVTHLILLREKLQSQPESVPAAARFTEASRIAREAEKSAAKARRERDLELLILHARYEVQKVTLYTRYDIGRLKLDLAFNTSSGLVPARSQESAWKRADRFHGVYVRDISVELTARQIRDRLAAELERGEHGPRFTPADLARLSGLTTARISQLRTGSSNRARAEKSAELRRQKALAAAEEAAAQRAAS